jgi:hypothetical protein
VPGQDGSFPVIKGGEAVTPEQITDEQAYEAKRLWSDAEAHQHLIALARVFPQEVKDQLRSAHDASPDGTCCSAHTEGMNCCLDILLDDPSRYDPEKVAAAKALHDRYLEQLRDS